MVNPSVDMITMGRRWLDTDKIARCITLFLQVVINWITSRLSLGSTPAISDGGHGPPHPPALRELLENVPEHMTRVPKGALDQIKADVPDLVTLARGKDTSVNVGRRRQALAAILYLLDPYDAVPDRYGVLGYRDDIAVLHKTHDGILRN